jgi:hypothetical protein
MNKILPIILVIIFSQFPEVSLGYDDRDSSDCIPRIGQGCANGEPGFFARVFGLLLFIAIFLGGLWMLVLAMGKMRVPWWIAWPVIFVAPIWALTFLRDSGILTL